MYPRFYRDRHESCKNACRRAFVGIGEPLMKGDARDFGEQAD